MDIVGYKVTSIYWGEIAQTPMELTSIFIIRGGHKVFKTGPHLLQALTPMAPGGAIYATMKHVLKHKWFPAAAEG